LFKIINGSIHHDNPSVVVVKFVVKDYWQLHPLAILNHITCLLQSSLLPPSRKTTQVLLAKSKLPQSLVYLIHIAVTPAILCSSVTAANSEAIILVLALLRNGSG
jgi:hypothetical protein